MLELVLLVLAFACVLYNVNSVAVFFLLCAVGVVAHKRSNLDKRLNNLRDNLRDEFTRQNESLREELSDLRRLVRRAEARPGPIASVVPTVERKEPTAALAQSPSSVREPIVSPPQAPSSVQEPIVSPLEAPSSVQEPIVSPPQAPSSVREPIVSPPEAIPVAEEEKPIVPVLAASSAKTSEEIPPGVPGEAPVPFEPSLAATSSGAEMVCILTRTQYEALLYLGIDPNCGQHEHRSHADVDAWCHRGLGVVLRGAGPRGRPRFVFNVGAEAGTPPPARPSTVRPPETIPTIPAESVSRPAPEHTTTARQRLLKAQAMEEVLGTNWLNKLGIIILVLGVALFGIYELGELGPAGKVAMSYAVSLVLLGGGIYLERRERYVILGRTCIGGGWALLFFTSYALNHVTAMRVLASETTDLVLMLAVAGAMVVHTLRYRSQLVTGLSFLLAFTTVALSHDDVYSLSAGAVLAVGLVTIVVRLNWFELEVFGILSSYLNHLYWLYRILGPNGAQGKPFPEFWGSTAILLLYWFAYRASYVVRRISTRKQERISTIAALLNTLLLLVTMKFQSARPELAFYALLTLGAAEFLIAQLPITRRRREAFVLLSILGAALMTAAVPFRYAGQNVAIIWLVGAEMFLAAGILLKEPLFRRLALIGGVLVGVHAVAIDLPKILAERQIAEAPLIATGVLFGTAAILFYLNACFVACRWSDDFSSRWDNRLLRGHSYLGAFMAGVACWALFVHEWTAVAFAVLMLVLAAISLWVRSSDLQVQFAAFGLMSAARAVAVNLQWDAPAHVHLPERLYTLPLIAAAFYLTAKLAQYEDKPGQRAFRSVFAAAGTVFLGLLIWYEVPEYWQPFAAAIFAVVLMEAGRGLPYLTLAWHAHLVALLALYLAWDGDFVSSHQWHRIQIGILQCSPVVVALYVLAKRVRMVNADGEIRAGAAYTWGGSALIAWVLFQTVPFHWISVWWIALAIGLTIAGRYLRHAQLSWQANAVAAIAIARAFLVDLQGESTVAGRFNLRLLTIAIVAAGLYAISRKAVPDSAKVLGISYIHTSAATALLAALAFREVQNGWLAAVWALFALTLALVDRRWHFQELPYQAHVLSAMAVVLSVTVNLHLETQWHNLSVRLLSTTGVIFVMYAMTFLVRVPEEWRRRDWQHLYSWAASALAASLMWYELQPLSIAVAWAAFGAILFEFGLRRQVRQMQFQGYVALLAAFARIFFANLNSGVAGAFWGPRLYTVLPIAAIFFFVYFELATAGKDSKVRARYLDYLFAYIATGTVVALLYFQFAGDWVATEWSALTVVLLGMALLLQRGVFLQQAILLSCGTLARGLLHNLFGSSYFMGASWEGRFLVLGSAIALMLLSLPIAFRLRRQFGPVAGESRLRRMVSAALCHPEQFMFFVPVLLLTVLLALKMNHGMVTVSWGIEGLAIFVLALLVKERSFRLTGLAILLLCVGKIAIVDAWHLAPRDRYITFIILGASLLLVSFLYSRYREAMRRYL